MGSVRITGKDHSSCLTNYLKEVYYDESYFDVALVVGDTKGGTLPERMLPEKKIIKANRMLLAAASQVFKEIFQVSPLCEDHRILIHMEGYSYLAVHELVHLIYHGFCPLIADMNEVVSILSDFQIAVPPSDLDSGTAVTSLVVEAADQTASAVGLSSKENEISSSPTEESNTGMEGTKDGFIESPSIAGTLIVPNGVLLLSNFGLLNGTQSGQENNKTVKPTCPECNKVFKNMSRLRRHMLCHTTEKPCMCEICGKTFKDIIQVKYHQRNHQDIRPYTCDTCGKKFKRREHLDSHNQQHTGVKAFVCELCGKGFACKKNLKDHLAKHSSGAVVRTRAEKGKVFDCPFCDKTFVKKFVFENHLRTHTGERPFSCNYCSKTFAQKVTLQTHLRTHAGDKLFTCNICQKSFVQKATLVKHMKKVHDG